MSPLFIVPLIYLASILQIGLAPHWQIAGAGPDLLAVVTIIWAIKSNGWHALAVAALVGMASDLNSTVPLGIGVAIHAVTAYGVVWWRRQVKLDRWQAQIAVVWTGVSAITLSELIAGRCLGGSVCSAHVALACTAVVGLYTTTIAAPILLVMSWWRERHEPALNARAS
jgi:rod shape-determining protein MreD